MRTGPTSTQLRLSSLISAYFLSLGFAAPSNLAFLDERAAVLERSLGSGP
jgi:hypothetical protein